MKNFLSPMSMLNTLIAFFNLLVLCSKQELLANKVFLKQITSLIFSESQVKVARPDFSKAMAPHDILSSKNFIDIPIVFLDSLQ